MKRYKQLNEDGEVVALLTYDFVPSIADDFTIEITAEEYENISTALRESIKDKVHPKVAERREREREKLLQAKSYATATRTNE